MSAIYSSEDAHRMGCEPSLSFQKLALPLPTKYVNKSLDQWMQYFVTITISLPPNAKSYLVPRFHIEI